MDELRECPFCWGHARMGLMCGSVGVTCQLCGASLVNETKETAIAAWNARVPECISTPYYDPVYGSSVGWNACRDAVLRGKG